MNLFFTRFASSFLILGSLVGCVGIHQGNFAKVVSDGKKSSVGLVVSGMELPDASSYYFGLIDFTFENKTSEWISIKRLSVDFDEPQIDRSVGVPVGAELAAWAEAIQQLQAIRSYNTSVVLGSVAALGSLTTLASPNRSAQLTGAGVATAGIAALAISDISHQRDAALFSKLVPNSHLLSDSFVIPPGLHAKKWIVLYTRDPYKTPRLNRIFLTYTTSTNQTEKIALDFREEIEPRVNSESKWQNTAWR